MKQFVKLAPMVILLIFIMLSCSSVEEVTLQHPFLSQLSNTECLSSKDIDLSQSSDESSNGSFEMVLVGDVAKCKFTSLEYPCDFGKVNVRVIYHEDVLIIVEYPSSDNADCRCEIDASFLIENFSQQDFTLKIYRGDAKGIFNPNMPKYDGKIYLHDNKITIPY